MACFRCSNCSKQIEDLTFSIINERLFCTECHKAATMNWDSQKRPSEANSIATTGTVSVSSRRASTSMDAVDRQTTTSTQDIAQASASSARSSSSTSPSFITQSDDAKRHIAKLEYELTETKKKLVETEGNYEKVKTIGKVALDEFNRIRDDFQREIVRRQQTEAIVAELQAEIQRLRANEKRLLQCDEEIRALQLHQLHLMNEVKDLTTRKDALALEVDMLQKRSGSLTTEGSSAPASGGSSSSGGGGEMELQKGLNDVKTKFRQEIESIQNEREALQKDIADLKKVRTDLMVSLSRLTAECKQLEGHQAALLAAPASIHANALGNARSSSAVSSTGALAANAAPASKPVDITSPHPDKGTPTIYPDISELLQSFADQEPAQ
ncbi:hypothetical protein HK102_011993, partial [Quaeritorhiza haematococci]